MDVSTGKVGRGGGEVLVVSLHFSVYHKKTKLAYRQWASGILTFVHLDVNIHRNILESEAGGISDLSLATETPHG